MTSTSEKPVVEPTGPGAEPPAHILVVDDRPTSRAVVQAVLASSRHRVSEAASGREALACLAREPFDLVILDILMPDIDGLTVLEEVRCRHPGVPVIMVTVKQGSDDVVAALERGASDYITKPIDFRVLLARLHAHLARKRAEDGLRTARVELERRVRERTAELVRSNHRLRHEVEERRRAEASARALEAQLRDFAEVAADWFWELDRELRFSYLSDRFETAIGIRPADALGRSPREVFVRDDGERAQQPRWARHFEDLERRRPIAGFEFLWRRSDGSTRVLRLSGKPVFDAGGSFCGYRGAGRDVTEAHTLSEELSYRASHDPLTGLANRREFEARLRRALETARLGPALEAAGVHAAEHALCYLDLDQFKLINDTCGHIAGDELLHQVGGLVRERVRRRDTVARLGGDEFGILMEHCSLGQARRVAENLRQAIDQFQFAWEDKRFNVSASLGLAALDRFTESDGAVLSAADSACCAAKAQGGNRVHVYDAADAELARWHGEMQWAERIQRALVEGRFTLYRQPIVPIDPSRREGIHYELLLRMRDERGNLVSASAFLPAAERYNLATRLDRWVVREALGWLARHPEHLANLHQCSINLSGRSLGDASFLEFVSERLAAEQVPPEKVCFEVTETSAIADLPAARRFIKALRARGCRFSLDDFGTGLSSFAYLKNLPVDTLKIDGMFIKDIAVDPIDLAMVRSINEIGRVMGKHTVAEFVEDEAVLAKLREAGVDYAQGYGVGPPEPIDPDPIDPRPIDPRPMDDVA